MLTRRNLLKRSSLIALAPTVPGFLARLARAVETKTDDRVLVVIQLDGGNDGINTVVPFRDEGYAKHRDKLRLPADRLHKLDDNVALHPSMRAMADLHRNQKLVIAQGVGYPNPNRSHDVSMAIWHTARFDRAEHKSYGWLGRALDQTRVAPALPDGDSRSPAAAADGPVPGLQGCPAAMLLGDGALPTALIGRRSIAGSFSRLDELAVRNDAARESTAAVSPNNELAAFVRRGALDAYATALRDWLAVDPTAVLAGQFEPVPLWSAPPG